MGQRVAKSPERQVDSTLARNRYAVITASRHFELTNALTALARAREILIDALFQLNAACVNLARSTGSLNELQNSTHSCFDS